MSVFEPHDLETCDRQLRTVLGDDRVIRPAITYTIECGTPENAVAVARAIDDWCTQHVRHTHTLRAAGFSRSDLPLASEPSPDETAFSLYIYNPALASRMLDDLGPALRAALQDAPLPPELGAGRFINDDPGSALLR